MNRLLMISTCKSSWTYIEAPLYPLPILRVTLLITFSVYCNYINGCIIIYIENICVENINHVFVITITVTFYIILYVYCIICRISYIR